MKSRKTKTIKKISLFFALAVLITMSLAVSVFAETTPANGATCYTVGDVNGDGKTTKADAVYLLYHSIFGDDYALNGEGEFAGDDAVVTVKDALYLLLNWNNPDFAKEVHVYVKDENPIWKWEESENGVTAKVTYTCECGAMEEELPASITPQTTAATCDTSGSTVYTAVAEHHGIKYTTSKTVAIPATGHVFEDGLKACHDKECINCDYVEEGAAHTISDLTTPTKVSTGICTFVDEYTCTVCNGKVHSEPYTNHVLKATVTTPATCKVDGVMTYKCTVEGCTYSYTEAIEDENAHTWGNASTDANGVTTYTCTQTGCTARKTAIKATNGQAASASKDAIANADEVEVNGTAIKLDDEVLSQLGGTITIDAQEKDVNSININATLAPDVANKIQSATIYDFTLNSTAGTTTDGQFGDGKVTVTIPYTLGANEDPDCIEVWYIATDGTVQNYQGTYSNGKVTFETNHFSYYTVVKLTPEERCAKWDHSRKSTTIAPTCTTAGYTRALCVRCGKVEVTNEVAALGHDTETNTTAATCTVDGKETTICKRECNYKKEVILPATGHDCVDTVVDATCSTKGYTTHDCKNCDYVETEYDANPVGHDYKETWNWDKKKLTATVTLECEREACTSEAEEYKAVVSMTKQIPATCAAEGVTEYSAYIKLGANEFEDTYTITDKQLPHKLGNTHKYNDYYHYKECSACGGRVNEKEHKLDKGKVSVDATCKTEGVKVYSCSCGYKVEEAIPVKAHNMVNGKCKDCGFTTIACDHEAHNSEEILFDEKDGYCGGAFYYSTCECGEYVYIDDFYNGCNLKSEYEIGKDANGNITRNWVEKCEDCGIKVEIAERNVVDDAKECLSTSYRDYKITNKSGKVVVEMSGIYFTEVEHATRVYVSEEKLPGNGICGGKVVFTKCACGTNKDVYMNIDCNFVYDYELDQYKCKDCGLVYTFEMKEGEPKDCKYNYTYIYKYTKDGKEIASYQSEGVGTWHVNTEYKFDLKGDDCSDGYVRTTYCKDCGEELYSYEETPQEGTHSTYYKEVDYSDYDICGDKVAVWSCACGKYSNSAMSSNHIWEYVDYKESENEYTDIYKCSNCDLVKTSTWVYAEKDDTCKEVSQYTGVYTLNGKEIHKDQYENVYYSHNDMVIAVEFLGKEKVCTDGVKVTAECKDCAKIHTDTYYYHTTCYTEKYDLKDYGMCNGTYSIHSCACGESQETNFYTECAWEYKGYNGKTQTSTWECNKCGITHKNSVSYETVDGCLVQETRKDEFIKGYEVLLSGKESWLTYDHDYKYDFQLNGTSCEDGYTVTMTCTKCGEVRTSTVGAESGAYHYPYTLKTYDLGALGLCEGEVYYDSCACGENSYYNQTNGCNYEHISYDSNTGTSYYKCSVCGSTRETVRVEGKKENCQTPITYSTVYYTKAGKAVLEYTYVFYETSHSYKSTVALKAGAVDCNDGVTVTQTCRDCGYSYSYDTTGHATGEVESLDLRKYGATCESYLVKNACACGESEYITTRGECDFGYHSTKTWIGEYYADQYTSNGWVGINHYANDVVCAVTSPKCNIGMRMCQYYVWDKENCSMKEYQVWQIGYDRQKDTYELEWTVNTETFAYHDYETTYVSEGESWTENSVCKNCNSTYEYTRTQEADGGYSYGRKAINTLANGEPLSYEYSYEYDYHSEYNYSYPVIEQHTTVYADGIIGYSSWTYVYDWANCERTTTYTSSNGIDDPYTNTYTDECHPTHSNYVQDVDQSCTQDDRWHYESNCPVCKQVVKSNYGVSDPWGHNYSYDSSKGVYVCSECGLESANGSDGTIVLEDMTADHGADTNYVIGYWNKSGMDFTYYVSVISGEEETILDSVNIKELTYEADGIRAISFGKAEVEAAMKAAKVTGDIRITFVPVGAGGSFDYGITLTK